MGGYYSPVLYENARVGATDMKTQEAVPTPIEPGQVKITAQVTTTYIIV
ncbi:MAG: hypothetical protein A4E40_00169 [Methanoregulaceae archaeon PtaU1.Bin059]|nr:MAG: hypothetical protein A4E40_00169 [Methanoregulaceae archaeon PtaU1.Bin059]